MEENESNGYSEKKWQHETIRACPCCSVPDCNTAKCHHFITNEVDDVVLLLLLRWLFAIDENSISSQNRRRWILKNAPERDLTNETRIHLLIYRVDY